MISRPVIVLSCTGLFFGLIVAVFWIQDWQYSLPTAKPNDLEQPAINATLALAAAGAPVPDGRPLFLHFFNPRCPCSAFNRDHVRDLIRRHSVEVRFAVVVQGGTAADGRDQFGRDVEVVEDSEGEIGRMAGVYSTPQAVLVDARGRLYFRGNYNASRYCSVRETEYARLALESLLARKSAVTAPSSALTAYGCPLPKRKKKAAAS